MVDFCTAKSNTTRIQSTITASKTNIIRKQTVWNKLNCSLWDHKHKAKDSCFDDECAKCHCKTKAANKVLVITASNKFQSKTGCYSYPCKGILETKHRQPRFHCLSAKAMQIKTRQKHGCVHEGKQWKQNGLPPAQHPDATCVWIDEAEVSMRPDTWT